MDVSPVLVADLQAPEAIEPGERPFDHLPVASQAVLGLDTTAGSGRGPSGFRPSFSSPFITSVRLTPHGPGAMLRGFLCTDGRLRGVATEDTHNAPRRMAASPWFWVVWTGAMGRSAMCLG